MSGSGAALAGFVGMFCLLMFAFVVLLVVARWKVFAKAGEKGWKSLIPVYSDYVQWRIGWDNKTLFWVMVIASVLGLVLMQMGGYSVADAMASSSYSPEITNEGFVSFGSILVFAAAILDLVALYKLFQSFGHGLGWFILYLLIPNIMLLVLGFGSSRYYGPRP